MLRHAPRRGMITYINLPAVLRDPNAALFRAVMPR